MTGSPEQIGERLAEDAWAREGRSLVLQPDVYAKALSDLTKKCGGHAARQAFDRRLARIAADAPIIVRPNLPKSQPGRNAHDRRSLNSNQSRLRFEKGHQARLAYLPSAKRRIQNPRTVSKQMALGMLPGIADLIVFSPEGKAHFMEFKSENGTLDEAQRDFQLWAIRANLPHSVVRSVDEAMKVFRFWGAIPEAAADGPRS